MLRIARAKTKNIIIGKGYVHDWMKMVMSCNPKVLNWLKTSLEQVYSVRSGVKMFSLPLSTANYNYN